MKFLVFAYCFIGLIFQQICQGQRNGRRLGNPNNCRAYVECQSNSRVDGSCENGQLFDPQLQSCMDAHIVRCGSRALPPLDSEPLLPNDFFPPCPRTGTIFRSHPHDCQGYFICASGVLIQHSCAKGIYFNPDTLQCDFAENVQCRLMRIPIPQTPLLPDCSTGTNFFPNLVNCKQYYICVKNEPILKDCPSGQLWDNMKLTCSRSETGNCARSFNAISKTFKYGAPRDDEKKS